MERLLDLNILNIPLRVYLRTLVGAAGSSLTDFGSYTSHSGVKDIAVTPIYSQCPKASSENRLPRSPPLAVASRSLTSRGYSAGSFRQRAKGDMT